MAFRVELSKQAIRSELKNPLPDGSTRNPYFDLITELTNFGYRIVPKGNGFILEVQDEELLNLKLAVDWVSESATLYNRPVEIVGMQGYYRATANALTRDVPEAFGYDNVVLVPAAPGREAIPAVLDSDGNEVRPAVPEVPAVDEVTRRPTIGELQADFVHEGFTYGPIPSDRVSTFVALEAVTGVKVVTPNAYQNKKAEYEASLGTGG